ncbi:hypothetical protein U1Q18_008582, partial [Sarracenia purpurea var. burkii]
MQLSPRPHRCSCSGADGGGGLSLHWQPEHTSEFSRCKSDPCQFAVAVAVAVSVSAADTISATDADAALRLVFR